MTSIIAVFATEAKCEYISMFLQIAAIIQLFFFVTVAQHVIKMFSPKMKLTNAEIARVIVLIFFIQLVQNSNSSLVLGHGLWIFFLFVFLNSAFLQILEEKINYL